MALAIRLKRVYEKPARGDGTRILVERLWPRGIRKEDAAIDHWFKEIAPSPDLRKWFSHDPAKWEQFKKRYRQELERNPDAVAEITDICAKGTVTFVFASRDSEHNNAVALKEYLEAQHERKRSTDR